MFQRVLTIALGPVILAEHLSIYWAEDDKYNRYIYTLHPVFMALMALFFTNRAASIPVSAELLNSIAVVVVLICLPVIDSNLDRAFYSHYGARYELWTCHVLAAWRGANLLCGHLLHDG